MTNPTKEILIYDYLLKSLEFNNIPQKELLTRVFYIIGNCINSIGFKIAEKANKSLAKSPLLGLLSRNASLLLPNILSNVEMAKTHWSNKVRLAAIEAFNIIGKFSVDISQWKRNTKVELERKRSNWILIARSGNSLSSQDLTNVLGEVVKLYK